MSRYLYNIHQTLSSTQCEMQLQLLIQFFICAPGTHYWWVTTGNVDSKLAKGFLHVIGAAGIKHKGAVSLRLRSSFFGSKYTILGPNWPPTSFIKNYTQTFDLWSKALTAQLHAPIENNINIYIASHPLAFVISCCSCSALSSASIILLLASATLASYSALRTSMSSSSCCMRCWHSCRKVS